MKRNDWIYLLAIAHYSFLFYQQGAGLNFLLFSIAIVAALGLMRPSAIRTKHWMISAVLVLVSGLAVYLNGSKLAIAANVTSLMLFSAQSAAPGTSLLVSFFLSVCSVGGAYVFMIIDFFDRRAQRAQTVPGEEAQKRVSGRFWAVLVAIVIVLIFFLLYRSTNVLFRELTKHINLDWISWRWCFFTLIGAVAVYGLFFLRKFGGIGENSSRYTRNLAPGEATSNWGDSLMGEDNERFLGLLLFGLLNVLVLFVNGVDLLFQFGDQKLPPGITLTSYVHQGVGLLILNVLMAMLLVLFFFRGRLNFNKSYGTLRILAVLWLFQNVLMLFFMAGRNNLYTELYGMTYKRIGVYFYLLLTAIGVATIAVKVFSRKTNTWLFRINTWLFFSVFVFASLISWSRFVTWYSLYKSDYVNRAYLSSMNYQSLPYLVELNVNPEKFSQKELIESYDDDDDLLRMMEQLSYRDWGNKNDFSVRIYRRVYQQLSATRSVDWRSRTFHGQRVHRELMAFPAFGTDNVLYLEYSDIHHIYYFPGFRMIERINMANNRIRSIGELGQYPNLEEADLSNNEITSLSGIEKCQSLKMLDLRGNPVNDLKPLLALKNLGLLYVDVPMDPVIFEMQKTNPNLIVK
jgi:hypothetical protein